VSETSTPTVERSPLFGVITPKMIAVRHSHCHATTPVPSHAILTTNVSIRFAEWGYVPTLGNRRPTIARACHWVSDPCAGIAAGCAGAAGPILAQPSWAAPSIQDTHHVVQSAARRIGQDDGGEDRRRSSRPSGTVASLMPVSAATSSWCGLAWRLGSRPVPPGQRRQRSSTVHRSAGRSAWRRRVVGFGPYARLTAVARSDEKAGPWIEWGPSAALTCAGCTAEVSQLCGS
jgi:hypothetical protein